MDHPRLHASGRTSWASNENQSFRFSKRCKIPSWTTVRLTRERAHSYQAAQWPTEVALHPVIAAVYRVALPSYLPGGTSRSTSSLVSGNSHRLAGSSARPHKTHKRDPSPLVELRTPRAARFIHRLRARSSASAAKRAAFNLALLSLT